MSQFGVGAAIPQGGIAMWRRKAASTPNCATTEAATFFDFRPCSAQACSGYADKRIEKVMPYVE
jgi:hypothetical protein